MRQPDAAYDELYVYTMGRPGFILQHVVDAHAAQAATSTTKPITLAFALVGLYLHVERGMDGSTVQRVHMRMGSDRRDWPRFAIPVERADLDPCSVLADAPGPERDQAIDRWCEAVWLTYASERDRVVGLAAQYVDC